MKNKLNMRKFLLLVAAIGIALASNAQSSIQSNLDKIQEELDKIMMESSSLPAYKRSAISSSVLNIKRLIGSYYSDPYDNNYYPQERILNDREFDNLILTIKQTNSFDARLMQINRVSRTTSFYMDQIHDILKLFPFSSERDRVRDIILPKAIDPENIRLLYDIYVFQSDQKRLEEILDNAAPRRGIPSRQDQPIIPKEKNKR
jgi:hypothetical protein